MNRPAEFVLHEFRLVLPPTLFFLVCFNMLALTIALMSPEGTDSIVSHGKATLAALIVGKAVLVADKLPFFNRYPQKPLIWNTVWKTLLYIAITALFRVVEVLLSAATDDFGFAAGVAEHAEHFRWARFAAVQMWLAILFFVYTGFRELAGQVGPERMRAMFFARPDRRP